MDHLRGRVQSFMLNDVEMGKKDDDFPMHKDSRPRGAGWRPSRVAPTRRGTKRFIIFVLITCAVYLFYKNMPKSNWRDRRHPSYGKQTFSPGQGPPGGWNYIPPRNKAERDRAARENAAIAAGAGKQDSEGLPADSPAKSGAGVEGPPEHPNLATTLQAISRKRGAAGTNKNVLFAASSLKSVANILPMACQMGKELRNDVHFALMSHSEVELKELLNINGVDEKCHIFFHDARIDHPTSSSEKRLKQGIQDALVTINIHMRPQAIIIDGSPTEETHFLAALPSQAGELGVGVIELPKDWGNSVSWMTKLDSVSLSVWNQVHIDILVSASSGTTGSLIRLLKSLSSADYSGVPIPHLTVELPPKVDAITAEFIRNFRWPPQRYSTHTPNQLTLRKRIIPRGINEDEANTRFMESFYPSNPTFNHVLVLSPQVEVEKHFFHYLRYTAFEYRHSLTAKLQKWDKRLFGIALDIPGTKVDGTSPFASPKSQLQRILGQETGFLWQAPVSHAMLFLGDKWAELHGLVEQSLAVQQGVAQTPALLEKKEITKGRPGWMEYVLRLNMLRGYWMLYPTPTTSKALVTIHTERALSPEEYAQASSSDTEEQQNILKEEEQRKEQVPLTVTLPGGERLLPLNDMPVLSWDGGVSSADELAKQAREYRERWRTEVGGCEARTANDGKTEQKQDALALDLFCPSRSEAQR